MKKRRGTSYSKSYPRKGKPAIFLASENQLAKLEMYSTSEIDFSIVQLETTFNLGPYERTPMSYRNLLLKSS